MWLAAMRIIVQSACANETNELMPLPLFTAAAHSHRNLSLGKPKTKKLNKWKKCSHGKVGDLIPRLPPFALRSRVNEERMDSRAVLQRGHLAEGQPREMIPQSAHQGGSNDITLQPHAARCNIWPRVPPSVPTPTPPHLTPPPASTTTPPKSTTTPPASTTSVKMKEWIKTASACLMLWRTGGREREILCLFCHYQLRSSLLLFPRAHPHSSSHVPLAITKYCIFLGKIVL